jgi:hypothetical protein
MPTAENPSSNQFRCESCGRHLDSSEDLKAHAMECAAAKATGSGSTETNKGRLEEGPDRDWVSTP